MGSIRISGACANNLKNLSCEIPTNVLVGICGPSGAGKSSLLFSTIGLEAKRRLLALTTEKISRKSGSSITGLGIAVPIESRMRRSRFATVGTLAGIYMALARMYVALGTKRCPVCSGPVGCESLLDLSNRLVHDYSGRSITLLSPLALPCTKQKIDALLQQGFSRVLAGGELQSLETLRGLADYELEAISSVAIDRFSLSPKNRYRLIDALKLAATLSDGLVEFQFHEHSAVPEKTSVSPRCLNCGRKASTLSEGDYVFSAPTSQCPRCKGRDLGLLGKEPCSACNSTRVKSEARIVTLSDLPWEDLLKESMENILPWIGKVRVDCGMEIAARRSLARSVEESENRLRHVMALGLGYLQLYRSLHSLSTGEMQRLLLARGLGNAMKGVTYLIEEPGSGLHPLDVEMLARALNGLTKSRSSALITEHTPFLLSSCDYLIELGPGSGSRGGQLVAQGTPEDLRKGNSATGLILRYSDNIPETINVRANGAVLSIKGITKHNLGIPKLNLPLSKIVAICGVSGSGKSTLLRDVIAGTLRTLIRKRKIRELSELTAEEKEHLGVEGVEGVEHLQGIVEVAIARSGRRGRDRRVISVLGIVPLLSELYALAPSARMMGIRKKRLSALISRKPAKGFSSGAIGFRGKSIAETLELTVDEAFSHFARVPRVARSLRRAKELGLGYLSLSQPFETLSSGERQRLCMVPHFNRKSWKDHLFLFDEPSRSLSSSELHYLQKLFQEILTKGGSVIYIDHNPAILKKADYLVELGPGAGPKGGKLIAEGNPRKIRENKKSRIAQFL